MSGDRFHPSDADKLIDPNRYRLFDPENLIEVFGIVEDDVVTDLGAGNGFFTIPLAGKTTAQVYAVDIEPEMLALLKERSDKAGIKNIQYVVSDLEEIKLDSHSIDKAISSLVLHEIADLQKALSEVKRILTKDGHLFVLEWEAIESEKGPPLHERIASTDMIEVLKKQGFEVELVLNKDAIYGLIAKLNKER